MKMRERPRDTLRFDTPRKSEAGYERRRLFQDFVREALRDKEHFPGLLGATGFGSIFSRQSNVDRKWHIETHRVPRRFVPFFWKTINTVQTDYSDIDAYLFFDPTKMVDAKVTSDFLFDQTTFERIHAQMAERMQQHLLHFLDSKMPELKDKHPILRNAYTSQLIRHVFPIPLNEGIIDARLDSYRYLNQNWGDYEVSLLLSQEHGQHIALLFHARMGKEIARLREHVFKKLLSMDRNRAQSIWADIMRRCENWENKGKKNERVIYPKTLEEGLRVYAPRLLKAQVLR